MPLYEYQCETCGHTFEKIQKFSDPPEETCPECGGTVKKLLSSPAIQFKGSGWYITDYARKSSSPDAAAPAKGDTSKTDASTSDAKTAAPASPTPASDSAKKD